MPTIREGTVNAEMIQRFKKEGWLIHVNERTRLILFKWKNGYRHEVAMIFDEGGRLKCWSHWKNERVELDDKRGLRDRLEAFLDWRSP